MSGEEQGRGGEERKGRPREQRLRGIFARRIFGEPPEEGESSEEERRSDRERRREEVKELFGSVLETGDKARMEIVRLVAREVRGYLEAMELHKDLHSLLTNYSLEVHTSFHLKPLVDRAPDARAEAPAPAPQEEEKEA
jgi:hypothetical protein